tara:strand:- start:111 stop:797 length:687 start_codon:yes stop_codon:yes gene_type:complete
MNISNIAIITARKGSKRIKNKNLKLFFGKPIIYYSIKALQKTKIFDRIYLSTNCEKTIEVSRKYGIKNFIKRNNYLSTNKIGTITVINHALKNLEKDKIKPKFVCCLYPAAPLTKYKNIRFSYEQIKKDKKMNFIYPSTIIGSHSKKKFSKEKIIRIRNIKKKEGIINRIYLDAGQFWYAKSKIWKKSKTIYNKNSYTFTIKEKFSDINTMDDWKKVEKIYALLKKPK